MSSRTSRVLLVLILLAAGGYGIYRFTRPQVDDRTQIEGLIRNAARFLEQQRVKSFMTVLADEYQDGTYSKADLEPLVRGAVLQSGEIRVVPFLRDLAVQGTTATVVLEAEVTVASRQPTGATSEPATERYTIELALAKGRHGWQVTSARGWESAQNQFGGGM